MRALCILSVSICLFEQMKALEGNWWPCGTIITVQYHSEKVLKMHFIRKETVFHFRLDTRGSSVVITSECHTKN